MKARDVGFGRFSIRENSGRITCPCLFEKVGEG